MDLTEVEDIKKRWQEYTEELCKKDLHDPDDHHGVITYLEPDVLESKVKWALGGITMNEASGGEEFQLSYFKYYRCCENAALNMPANLENSAVATGLQESIFIPIQRKAIPKNVQSTTQLHSSHMLAK